MEGFICSRLIPQMDDRIDHRQYVRKGHSTTDALLYMLQAFYEAVDSGNTGALQIAHIARLEKRRGDLCVKYMEKMKSKDHPLHSLLPRALINQPEHNLRKNADKFYLLNESVTCRTKRPENFFTFRYFN